jgi:sugar phosphate isomerase/epimerase
MLTPVNRRHAIQTTVTAFAAANLSAAPLFASETEASSSIRIGCCAANFHGFSSGTNPLPAIQQIGEMGFEGIELILLAPEDLGKIWSESSLDNIEAALKTANLTVSRFGVFGPCMKNIASDANAARDADLAIFEKACSVAKRLGALQMGYVGWSVPGTSPFTYRLAKEAAPGTKIVQRIPYSFDWDKFWARSVDSNRELLFRAKAHGMTICIEPHFHGIPQTAEQFLLLHREVNDPALGYLLDSCWTSVQAAYPPLVARMMAPHITQVQFRDTDATTRNSSVPFGQGAVDFSALLTTLKAIRYQGFISLEEVFLPARQTIQDAKNFLAFMRTELAKP